MVYINHKHESVTHIKRHVKPYKHINPSNLVQQMYSNSTLTQPNKQKEMKTYESEKQRME